MAEARLCRQSHRPSYDVYGCFSHWSRTAFKLVVILNGHTTSRDSGGEGETLIHHEGERGPIAVHRHIRSARFLMAPGGPSRFRPPKS